MAAEEFFNRWSKAKNKAECKTTDPLASPQLAVDNGTKEAQVAESPPLPQMHDVEQLHAESDFSVFMRDGVDESVRRSAMKKLFTNPHFNVMDGLDIYVADYSQPDPLPEGMLGSLRHAEMLLNPLRQLAQPLQSLLQRVVEPSEPSESSNETVNLDLIALPDIASTPVALQNVELEDELKTKVDATYLANYNDKDPIQV
ncbi:DUF3306 domain-containing protein [Undibacterium sp. Ren11W]|uniref:DUF3306 domain-containing protein n=1 Tax=Undibacterium sp. Ren11W TaxID=3413045 RepID=UPI003BF18E7C